MKVAELADLISRIDELHAQGHTDGLPVIPPETGLVDDAVARTGRGPDEVLGVMPPRYIEVTVRDIAVNAIMAGCRPEYLPVVIAAIEVLLHPDSNPMGVATTTKGVAPMLIINGPIRHELQLNSQGNLFGPGPRANATIGRAVRLSMVNLGGAAPRILDKTTIGHPGKYTLAIAEDEEGSPWEPLHVAGGFSPSDNVVTVIAVEGATQIMTQGATKPETILDTFAESMNVASHYTTGGPCEIVIILGPEHRATMREHGWSRGDIQRYLVERCWRTAGELWDLERDARGFAPGDPRDSKVPLFSDPSEIFVVAAGGAGVSSTLCWGYADHRLLGHSGQRRIEPLVSADGAE